MTDLDGLISDPQKELLRKRSDIIGIGLILHAWGTIFICTWVAALFPNIFTLLLAGMLIGSRQLGLLILMHDAAHGLLFKSSKLNHFFGQWLCGIPMFADLTTYRPYHLKHHKHVLTQKDPDLVLTGHYPIPKSSLKRKLMRDISGQSGITQRTYQLKDSIKQTSGTKIDYSDHFWKKMGRSLLCNMMIFFLMLLLGPWWLFFVCWLIPLLTWYQLVLRVRNIAEHAAVEGDNSFQVARSVKANILEKIFIAPYWVHYHLEHHLLMWVPCYRLPQLNKFLCENGYKENLKKTVGYLNVLKEVTCESLANDPRSGSGAKGTFGQGYS